MVNIPPGSVDPPDSRLKVKPQYTTARDNFNKEANFLTSDSVLKYLGCVLESPLLCLDGGPGGWRKKRVNIIADFIEKAGDYYWKSLCALRS